MRTLDELRNALGAEYDKGQGVTRYRMDDIFTEFERQHPGLVDLTATCDRCNGPYDPTHLTGCFCPACAKEATP